MGPFGYQSTVYGGGGGSGMWPMAAIGLASAGASLLGNIWGAKSQQRFEERMSNTAYQRAVRDMYKAGLNPMLAYSQGPASTPGVGMPQPGVALGEGLMSAGRARYLEKPRVDAEVRLADATSGRQVADTAKAVQDTATSAADARLKDQLAKESVVRSGYSAAQTKRELLRLQREELISKPFQLGNWMLDWYGKNKPGAKGSQWQPQMWNVPKVTSGKDLKRKMEAAGGAAIEHP